MKKVSKAELKSLVIWYTATLIVLGLLFLASWNKIDYFLDNVFPDPAADDLNLLYVLNHLPFYFWLFCLLVTWLVVHAIKEKNIYLLFIAVLYFNIQFFILMRSNYEFYIWMLQGPQPGYGGLGAGMAAFGVFSLASLWILVEYLNLFFIPEPIEGSSPIRNTILVILKCGRVLGLLFAIVISYRHFFPILMHLVQNGL